MEDSFMEEDLHRVSKKILKENKLYPIEYLFENGNWNNTIPLIVYPQVGSFSKFIIEKYGKDKFKELYKNTSRKNDLSKNLAKVEKIYHKNTEQLEKEWLRFLKGL